MCLWCVSKLVYVCVSARVWCLHSSGVHVPRESPVSTHLPSTEVRASSQHAWLFHRCWESALYVSGFCSKHFTLKSPPRHPKRLLCFFKMGSLF